MTWWQTIIAVSIFCVCVSNAAVINGTESVREPVDKPKSIDICMTPECVHTASWILTNSNFSVDPCDDFYEFACGNVNLANMLDDTPARTESMLVDHELLVRLRSLIKAIDKAKVPKHFGLVRTLYDNCMSSALRDSYPASLFLPRYYQYVSKRWPVLLGNKWNDTRYRNKSIFLGKLLSMPFQRDSKNLEYDVPYLTLIESELTSEILRMGFDNDIVQAYYSLMVDTAVLFNATGAQVESELKEALLLGIDFAKCTPPAAKRFMLMGAETRTTVGEFLQNYSKLDFRSVIFDSVPADYNLTDNDVIVLYGDFGEFEKVLSNASVRALMNWVAWLHFAPQIPKLGPEFYARKERFNDFKSGAKEKPSMWKQCVKAVGSNLDLSLSALYQRKYMSQKIMSDLVAMVTNMKQQVHQLLRKADWLGTEATRDLSEKIDTMISLLPYRNEYVDDKKLESFYEKVELVEGKYQDSLNNISIGTSNATFHPLRSPHVRDDWIQLGNILAEQGFYIPYSNILYIGAEVTWKNFYHIDRPKYTNYGTFGFVVAHEMCHALDPSGIQIDKQIKPREWWSPEIKQRYDERIQCLVDQYGNYTIEELGTKLNGLRLALENTADNIGLKVAYNAYVHWAGQNREEKQLPALPFTPKQMFWFSTASLSCSKLEKRALRYEVATETHSPAKQRINGALANSQQFADDFKCKPGTKMNPVQKCSVL